MGTNFTTLEQKSKIVAETVFTHYINSDMEIKLKPECQTSDYNNVLHIGYDKRYGDVFKCWQNDSINFTIYFGTKGDEFNQ